MARTSPPQNECRRLQIEPFEIIHTQTIYKTIGTQKHMARISPQK